MMLVTVSSRVLLAGMTVSRRPGSRSRTRYHERISRAPYSLDFERVHGEVYRDVGFRVLDVPAAPLADRVALIRRTLPE